MYSLCRVKNDAFAGFAGCPNSMDMAVFFLNKGCSGPTVGEYDAIHAISESAPVQSYWCTQHRGHVFPHVAPDGKSILESASTFRLVTHFWPNPPPAKIKQESGVTQQFHDWAWADLAWPRRHPLCTLRQGIVFQPAHCWRGSHRPLFF